MATPPEPRIYMADDWSWNAGASTAWQNYYVWDAHGSFGVFGYGTGAGRGWGFRGEPSSGIIRWQIVDQDTLVAITSATCGQCIGVNETGHDGSDTPGASPILYFMESGALTHMLIDRDLAGHLRAVNGDGTILGTSDFILPPSAPDGTGPTYHLEAIVTVHSSAGTVQVWVNDILILDLTGKDTQNGGTGVIGFAQTVASASRQRAEWFVHSGTARLGSQWRAGYGNVGTDGTYSNGTAVGAATFLQAVDEPSQSGEAEDTSYGVLDATSTPKKTSFQMDTLPATWLTIRDVFPQIVIKKSDGGANTAKTGLKSGATEVYNASAYGVPDAWVARRLALRVNPAAGTPLWTRTSTMASEIIIDRET